jgi:phage replication-related protein YjqB (UPF0714/DUF867 family)
MGRYASYHELRQHETEGVDYRIQVREALSPIAVMAPHGGEIEPGTLELADAVAGIEYAFYAFEGKKPKGNGALHITSTSFDEPIALRLVRKSRIVLALHGCEGLEEKVHLGGRDEDIKARIKEELEKRGFAVEEEAKPAWQGRHSQNICNRGQTGRGVQLELTRSLRKKMFTSLEKRDGNNRTETFRSFVSALREVLSAIVSGFNGSFRAFR